jgi:hypothetical protein
VRTACAQCTACNKMTRHSCRTAKRHDRSAVALNQRMSQSMNLDTHTTQGMLFAQVKMANAAVAKLHGKTVKGSDSKLWARQASGCTCTAAAMSSSFVQHLCSRTLFVLGLTPVGQLNIQHGWLTYHMRLAVPACKCLSSIIPVGTWACPLRLYASLGAGCR